VALNSVSSADCVSLRPKWYVLSSVSDVFLICMLTSAPENVSVNCLAQYFSHVQCSSQWMSPDDGDIRRRNMCRDIIMVSKGALVW
jgi:hypothetical protein